MCSGASELRNRPTEPRIFYLYQYKTEHWGNDGVTSDHWSNPNECEVQVGASGPVVVMAVKVTDLSKRKHYTYKKKIQLKDL
jgi:hypothetical protein